MNKVWSSNFEHHLKTNILPDTKLWHCSQKASMSESDIWILFFWSNLFPHLNIISSIFQSFTEEFCESLTEIFLHSRHKWQYLEDVVKEYGRYQDCRGQRQEWQPLSVCSNSRWYWRPSPCPQCPTTGASSPSPPRCRSCCSGPTPGWTCGPWPWWRCRSWISWTTKTSRHHTHHKGSAFALESLLKPAKRMSSNV